MNPYLQLVVWVTEQITRLQVALKKKQFEDDVDAIKKDPQSVLLGEFTNGVRGATHEGTLPGSKTSTESTPDI